LKKSRIFFTATLIVAISGVIIAKAHTNTVTYKYIDPNNPSSCLFGTFADNQCPPPGLLECEAIVLGKKVRLYTASGSCLITERVFRTN
jgi:hypothetical protein